MTVRGPGIRRGRPTTASALPALTTLAVAAAIAGCASSGGRVWTS